MTLLERTVELRARAEKLGELQQRADEFLALDSRCADIADRTAGLTETIAKSTLLREAGLCLAVAPAVVGEAQRLLEKVRTRFFANRMAAELTKGKDWTRLLEKLAETTSAVRESSNRDWRIHMDALFTGETPEQLEASLAKTDANTEVLGEYKRAYEEYRRLRQKLPETAAEVENAREVAGRLGTVAQRFDFDVPAEVKEFLDAVAQGGASLAIVTDAVRDWLARNRLTERYRVVAVRQ